MWFSLSCILLIVYLVFLIPAYRKTTQFRDICNRLVVGLLIQGDRRDDFDEMWMTKKWHHASRVKGRESQFNLVFELLINTTLADNNRDLREGDTLAHRQALRMACAMMNRLDFQISNFLLFFQHKHSGECEVVLHELQTAPTGDHEPAIQAIKLRIPWKPVSANYTSLAHLCSEELLQNSYVEIPYKVLS